MNHPLTPNPSVIDPATDAQLRALDAAQPTSDPARAATTMDAILATDPAATPTGDVASTWIPATRRRHPLRWAAAASAVTLLGGGAFAASTATAPNAYASWTATPSPVSDEDLAKVVAACRNQVGTIGGNAPGQSSFPASELDVRLAERRGTWVAVLLSKTTPDRYTWDASCLAQLPTNSAGDPTDVSAGASGGGGFAPPPAGAFTQGSIGEFGRDSGIAGTGLFASDREPASVTSGFVGPDVVGLTIHSQGVTAEASLKDGTYAVWWPGSAFDLSAPLPPSGQGGPGLTIRYDLTLRDGTVIKDAQPWNPS